MSHIYLSASHKSSGKTSISIGLLAAVAERGLVVQPFKKGPDYIDPMWLTLASERPCYNLDYNTQSDDEIRTLFDTHASTANFALIEGNKGLFDGLDMHGSDCNAAVAKLLQTPIVLVLDTQGITRGLVPLVLGYQAFDTDIRIAGLILNRVASSRHENKLRASLEHYTDVPILGAVGRYKELVVTERHLGLTTPCEQGASRAKIECLKMAVNEGVDIDHVLEIAEPVTAPARLDQDRAPDILTDIRIGVARDAAFSFHYQDDFEALERAGAELVFFNALKDERLPIVDGLFLGGGFPETQMEALEENASMRDDIQRAAKNGMPIYAECGGMMYLCRSITWRDENREMAGVIPADAVMHDKPQGRGLVRLEETGSSPWSMPAGARRSAEFNAHEFHYAALENCPADMKFAYRVLRGKGIKGRQDGIVTGNVLANFCHLRDTSKNHWAERFVAFVRACLDKVETRQHSNAGGVLSD